MAAATMEARMIGTITGPPAFTISNMASLHRPDFQFGANTSSFASNRAHVAGVEARCRKSVWSPGRPVPSPFAPILSHDDIALPSHHDLNGPGVDRGQHSST